MSVNPAQSKSIARTDGLFDSTTASASSRPTFDLFDPLAPTRAHFQHWIESRVTLADSLTLTQRNVYIVPTRVGWMLALTLLLLLVASINYQLNLGYLLTFLLAGSALAGMHVSHGTLSGMAMSLIAPPAQFAGASALIDITLTSNRRTARYGVGLRVIAQPSANAQALQNDTQRWAWTDVPAQGSGMVQIAFTPKQRGLHRLPTLTAETRFPLGTFRVWAVWRPAAQILVYPSPELKPPALPMGESLAGHANSLVQRPQSVGDYDGLRAYRRGDPMKLVVWKKAARAQATGSDELVSRDSQQTQQQTLWIDAQATGLSQLEARLSRLCAWVLMADSLDLDYGLRVADKTIGPAQGEAHKRACLEALATC